MEFDVTVQIAGEDVLAGRLYQNVRHGDETVTFSYDPSYLNDPRCRGSHGTRDGRMAQDSSGRRHIRSFDRVHGGLLRVGHPQAEGACSLGG